MKIGEWLRKKIVKWLRTPEHVDYYYIDRSYFIRESPRDKPYMKSVGEVIKRKAEEKK
jgi:hypothetical protein